MAGRKQSRARHEQAVLRVAEVGAKQAAPEAGARRRDSHAGAIWLSTSPPSPSPRRPCQWSKSPSADEIAATAIESSPEPDEESLDRIERLRRDTHTARLVAAKAIKQTERLIDRGRAGDRAAWLAGAQRERAHRRGACRVRRGCRRG